mmetsp:Transcript_24552/g.27438  ORF Transcript_24552/g.27438 Transcript_24552/m.27438 type:complete len:420 (-) Transcript_24552:751-2010(-)
MNRNMNMNQNNTMRSQIDSLPFLSSIPKPLPQSFVLFPPLSMPPPLPIPSTLFRSGTSNSPNNSSNKERTIHHVVSFQHSSAIPVPSTFPSPHQHRWIIRELQELPSDYSLVRTNVSVPQEEVDTPLLQPPQVADRLCQTLKSLSITIIHDDNDRIDPDSSNIFADDDGSREEENILLVETQDNVKFAIRLFSSKGNTMIVVEIRRTSGCTVAFRSAAKTLLRSVVVAASTNTNAQQEQRTTTVGGQGGDLVATTKRRKFTIPVSLPKRSQEDLYKCIEDDFHIAYKMIHSPKYETQLFGLESLEQLTRNKDDKTNDNDQVVKNVVARFVLLGKGGDGGKDCDHDDCDDCVKQLLLLLDTTSTTTTDQPSRTSHHHYVERYLRYLSTHWRLSTTVSTRTAIMIKVSSSQRIHYHHSSLS